MEDRKREMGKREKKRWGERERWRREREYFFIRMLNPSAIKPNQRRDHRQQTDSI